MLTVLEVLIIMANLPVLVWPFLPIKNKLRFLDFMPLASVIFMVLHLFVDNESVPFRFFPLYIFTITAFLITIPRLFRHDPNLPKKRTLAAIGHIPGVIALIICVLVPTVVLPFYALPQPTGNFDVGTVVCDLTDRNRTEAFSSETGKAREIAVQFWYPTDKTGRRQQKDLDGAPVSTLQNTYPVVIFSHGAFGVRMSNASTFRELASHGYIVASIDHTYHSFYTAFADGRKIPVNTEFLNEALNINSLPSDKSFEISHEWLKLRTDDMKFAVDSLKSGELGAGGQLLNGHMDLSKIGLFGHSLGGAAAVQVCRERNDVKAAIDIDGTMIGDIIGIGSDGKDILSDKSFNKPLMLMYGSLFNDPEAKATSYAPNIKAFNNSADTAYSLMLKESGHLNFTDLPRISPLLSRMLGTGTIDSFNCIKIVNEYTLAFFDKHIKGQTSTLLDGSNVYKEVEFEKHNN